MLGMLLPFIPLPKVLLAVLVLLLITTQSRAGLCQKPAEFTPYPQKPNTTLLKPAISSGSSKHPGPRSDFSYTCANLQHPQPRDGD